MATKEKACLNCKRIFTETVCPGCGQTTFSETFKGQVHIFNPEKSEIAKKLKIKQAGEFAIKTK